jgi:hypothetical protein
MIYDDKTKSRYEIEKEDDYVKPYSASIFNISAMSYGALR